MSAALDRAPGRRAQAGAKRRADARPAHAGAHGHWPRASSVRCRRSGQGHGGSEASVSRERQEQKSAELAATGDLPAGRPNLGHAEQAHWHAGQLPAAPSAGRIAGDAHIGQFCVGSVDRRFNRARYDADAAPTAFAAGLKDVVDQDSNRDDLATVVRQAWEPAYADVDQPAAEAHLCHFATVVGPVCGHAGHRRCCSPLGRRWPPALWLPGGGCAGRSLWADGGP
jgi:hypothetical protein